MLNFIRSSVLAIMALALYGCGGDSQESTAPKQAMPAASQVSAPAASEMASGTIDHSLDEVEFELRRSINGLERMIEQYKADGYETGELEAQKAELSANLDALMQG